ncbi:hypothetical protein OG889_43515 [Streptomyces sp. NBC_00481]|nr:hypothetical protein [Streptomyces sp. NBC_00481]WRZ00950.1 hypothetical protein OG889_43515 [Streptomyces sp. NBC_00481]
MSAEDVPGRIQAAGVNPLDRMIRDEMNTILPSSPPPLPPPALQ